MHENDNIDWNNLSNERKIDELKKGIDAIAALIGYNGRTCDIAADSSRHETPSAEQKNKRIDTMMPLEDIAKIREAARRRMLSFRGYGPEDFKRFAYEGLFPQGIHPVQPFNPPCPPSTKTVEKVLELLSNDSMFYHGWNPQDEQFEKLGDLVILYTRQMWPKIRKDTGRSSNNTSDLLPLIKMIYDGKLPGFGLMTDSRGSMLPYVDTNMLDDEFPYEELFDGKGCSPAVTDGCYGGFISLLMYYAFSAVYGEKYAPGLTRWFWYLWFGDVGYAMEGYAPDATEKYFGTFIKDAGDLINIVNAHIDTETADEFNDALFTYFPMVLFDSDSFVNEWYETSAKTDCSLISDYSLYEEMYDEVKDSEESARSRWTCHLPFGFYGHEESDPAGCRRLINRKRSSEMSNDKWERFIKNHIAEKEEK